jgi:transcriptional regulator with XRE-family HTH domain
MYEKFLKLLENKGVSAYKVSQATGISQQTFTDWKHGRYEPKREKIQKLADYFGVDISYFYGEDDKPSYYLDEQTAKLAQLMREDPNLKLLFSADKKVREETLEQVKQILKIMKGNKE